MTSAAIAAIAARRKDGERITVDSIWRTNALGAAALSKMNCLGPARKNCPDRACPPPLNGQTYVDIRHHNGLPCRNMTVAYSYVRFSSRNQAKGDSLRRQLETSREFAAKQGWSLIEDYADLGVSGFTGSNIKDGDL